MAAERLLLLLLLLCAVPPPYAYAHETPVLDMDGKYLLYDYVPWEQLSKQRRGIMWAWQAARGMGRTLVLPPFRFQTEEGGAFKAHSGTTTYEYYGVSQLLELDAMRALHPVVELRDFLELFGGEVDLLFHLQRGAPPATAVHASADWVEGECDAKLREARECTVEPDGSESCVSPLLFAGTPAVRVLNLSCGWAPNLRFDRIITSRAVRDLKSVGVGPIVFQVPPPRVWEFAAACRNLKAASRRPNAPPSMSYASMRSAMRFKTELVDEAARFLKELRLAGPSAARDGAEAHEQAALEAVEVEANARAQEAARRAELARVAAIDSGQHESLHAAREAQAATGRAAALAAAERASLAAATAAAAAAEARAAADEARAAADEARAASAAIAALHAAGEAPREARVLAIHWRRGDFLKMHSGREKVCDDEATGEKLPRCTSEEILKGPAELARIATEQLARHNASVVFLASNAKDQEREEFERQLGGVPVVRYTAPQPSAFTNQAQLAAIDSLICALADAFLGTRRSMFTFTIFEERILFGHEPSTARYM